MSTRMIYSLLAVALIGAVLVWQFRSRREGVTPGKELAPIGSLAADSATLDALRKAGADLTKPTHVLFYLYLPTETAANQAAEMARSTVLTSTVRKAATGSQWLCLLEGTMIPSLPDIHAQSQRLAAIVAGLAGEYDGWEAAVEK